MAAFPPYARLLFSGAAESFDPGIVRSEMERGLPKQRIQSSRVLAKLKVTALFRTRADSAAFEDWYHNTILRIGFFDVTHPRTGQVISARFENADIGELQAVSTRFGISQRSFVLEYLR